MADELPNEVARVKLEKRKQYNQYNPMVSVNKREVKNEPKATERVARVRLLSSKFSGPSPNFGKIRFWLYS